MVAAAPRHWLVRWLGSLLLILGLTAPAYFLALWSYGSGFLETASSETKGWLVVFFPMLAIPPAIAWMKVALPASLALGAPHPIARGVLAMIALIWTVMLDPTENAFERVLSRGTDLTAVGTLSPTFFKTVTWVLALIGLVLSIHAEERSRSRAETA